MKNLFLGVGLVLLAGMVRGENPVDRYCWTQDGQGTLGDNAVGASHYTSGGKKAYYFYPSASVEDYLPAATRTGYTPDWKVRDDTNGEYAVTSDLTMRNLLDTFHFSLVDTCGFVCHWTPITYAVRFDANGGTGTMADEAFAYDQTKALTANAFARTGYAFVKWNTQADGGGTAYANAASVKNLSAQKGATVTLYAQWTANTYAVRFNANGGTGTMADEAFAYDQAKALTANAFARTGYAFVKWNTQADGGGTAYANAASVKNLAAQKGATVTLYAQWTANTYAVRFDANGGTGTMDDQAFTYDQAQTLDPNAFTRSGWLFAGWRTNETAGTRFADRALVSNLTERAQGTVRLLAQWNVVSYGLAYDANGGSLPAACPASYTVTNAVTLPVPTRTGYVFMGWYEDKSWAGTRWTQLPCGTTGDKSFVARWAAATYRVRFLSNEVPPDENEPVLQVFEYGTPQQLRANLFTRTGYSLARWNTRADGTGKSYADGQTVNNLTNRNEAVVDLYAQWVPNGYVVRFDPNGGTGTMADQTFAYDEARPLASNAFTRAGYAFVRWRETETGATHADGAVVSNLTATAGATVALAAQWQAGTYVAAFDANGGTGTMASMTLTVDQPTNLTACAFARDGYGFAGWNTQQVAEVAFADGAAVTNLTRTSGETASLYAVWTGVTYQVALNAGEAGLFDGRFATTNLAVTTGSNYPAFPEPAATNRLRRFLAWSPVPETAVPPPSANVTNFVARWGYELDEFGKALDLEDTGESEPFRFSSDSWTVTQPTDLPSGVTCACGTSCVQVVVTPTRTDLKMNLPAGTAGTLRFSYRVLATTDLDAMRDFADKFYFRAYTNDVSAGILPGLNLDGDALATAAEEASWRTASIALAPETGTVCFGAIRFAVGGGELRILLDQFVWEPETSYTIRYVDGETQETQTHEYGQVYNLRPAPAAAGGRVFRGWACSNGRFYEGGALVFDLARPGGTVTMTAVWE